jgi:catechol 2,3-dioxygenase-like lactoylglutathione lyase family enzyme
MNRRWYTRPVLFVAEIERAAAFYIEKLGFHESWRHVQDGKALVAQVERDGCELILSCQQPEKTGRGVMFISLDVAELEAARAAFEREGVAVFENWWGYRLAIVDDPDGNQLQFPYPNEDTEP